jgi:hypothetical protein
MAEIGDFAAGSLEEAASAAAPVSAGADAADAASAGALDEAAGAVEMTAAGGSAATARSWEAVPDG